MIYPQSFEQKIGFDRLREQIAALCNSAAGRAIIEAEMFSTSRSDVEFRQDIADEMRVVLMLESDAPRDEYPEFKEFFDEKPWEPEEIRNSEFEIRNEENEEIQNSEFEIKDKENDAE